MDKSGNRPPGLSGVGRSLELSLVAAERQSRVGAVLYQAALLGANLLP